MPRYHATDVDIRLVATDLVASTTPQPSHHNDAATRTKLNKVEQAFQRGSPLVETDVPCLGEDTRVHFFGSSPFLLVLATPHTRPTTLTDPVPPATPITHNFLQGTSTPIIKGAHHKRIDSLTDSPLTSLASTPPPLSPSGSFHLIPLDNATSPSFSAADDTIAAGRAEVNRDFDTEGSYQPKYTQSDTTGYQTLHLVLRYNLSSVSRRTTPKQDPSAIKFEVYVNGELTACSFTPPRSFTKSGREVETIISGRRIGRLVERAWLLAVPTLNHTHVEHDSSHVAQRWKRISEALFNQANACGRTKTGRRTPTGDYLANLCEVEMPSQLPELVQAATKSFGVLDVIAVLGEGYKDETTAGYCNEPERLRSRDCVPFTQSEVEKLKQARERPRFEHTNAASDEQSSIVNEIQTQASTRTSSVLQAEPTPPWSPWDQHRDADQFVLLNDHESHPHRTPLTLFCDLGSPISIPSTQSNDDDYSARTPTFKEHSQCLPLSSDHTAWPVDGYHPVSHNKAEKKVVALAPILVGAERTLRGCNLSIFQRIARSPTSPKHDGALLQTKVLQTSPLFDVCEVTQELIDKGFKHQVDFRKASYAHKAATATANANDAKRKRKDSHLGSSHESLHSPWKREHSAIENELRKLKGERPVIRRGKSRNSASLTRSSSQETLAIQMFAGAQAEAPPQSITPSGRQRSARRGPSVSSQQPQDNSDPQATKRKRFPDQDIVEQTYLSLDSRRSIRPRPRPSYEGLDRTAQAVAGAQENEVMSSRDNEPITTESSPPLKLRLSSGKDSRDAPSTPKGLEKLEKEASTPAPPPQRSISRGTSRMRNNKVRPSPRVAEDSATPLPQNSMGSPNRMTSESPSAVRTPVSTLPPSWQEFQIPELSRDCTISYADEGQKWEDGTLYGVRQVRAQRGGVFTEREVLLGVRFLVTN